MGRRRRMLGWGVAGAWVWWRHFGPEIPPRQRGPQVRPSRLTGRSVVVGQHEFFVRETGPADGPPLLLVHGWVYDSLGTFHRVLEDLAEDFRVIAVDHRNHGKSDRIRGRYAIETAADEVAGVMDALALPSATVFGYSMGGMIAQAMALRHPGRVDRLVLAATAALPIPERRLLTRAGFAAARAIGVLSPDLGARISYHYLLSTGAIDRAHGRWLWEQLLNRDIALYFEAAAAIHRFDARAWVGTLVSPALVIIPTADQLIPPAAQYELAALVPGAGVVELVGAGHEAILTHAADIVTAVRGFVPGRRPGPSVRARG